MSGSSQTVEALGAAAVAIKNRLSGARSEPEPVKACAALLRTVLRSEKPSVRDLRLLKGMEEPLLHLYPNSTPWSGAELNELLNDMCDLLEQIASDRPVHRDKLNDAEIFCSELYGNYRLARQQQS